MNNKNQKIYASLKSIASYIPNTKIDNNYFVDELKLDTNDEWIVKRTGIKTRYKADDNENTSDLGAKAGKIAIKRAGLKPNDLDLIICATMSPDYLTMPSTACVIANKLGLNDIMAFDISSACSGFVYMLNIAKSFILSGEKKNILIIGSEKLSKVVDYTDRGTCMLFGDGAGASVISATTNKNEAIIDVSCSSDGSLQDLLYTPLAKDKQFVHMKGNEIFKLAVRRLSSDVIKLLEKNNIKKDEIDLFIPHQANKRILDAVARELNLSDDKCIVTVDKYGNTSAASIPMAIDDAYNSKKLKKSDLIVINAFGGGLTWGSAVLRFGGENL
jgi:3-oxoacyl-[acyl-carrier-protein] synthase-3